MRARWIALAWVAACGSKTPPPAPVAETPASPPPVSDAGVDAQWYSPPEIVVGSVAVQGDLAGSTAHLYLRTALPLISHCLSANQIPADGKATATVAIGGDGAVTSVDIEGQSEAVAACVRYAISAVTFRMPEDATPVTVTTTLEFTPR